MKSSNLISCVLSLILFSSCLNDRHEENKTGNPIIDSVYNSWKKVEAGNLTLLCPKDWIFKEKEFSSGIQYGLNPPLLGDMENFFVFEIIEMPTGGQPFKEFQNAAFNSYYKRTSYYVEIISEEPIKFDGLDGQLVQLDMRGDSSQVKEYISMYIINGINKYYSISVNRDIAESKIKLDGVLNLILKSVRISI